MTDTENLIEKNRENLEKAYYRFFGSHAWSEDEKQVEAFRALETALVNLGILEPDEEPEEEEPEELDYTNDAQHWDEWAADQQYDVYRDLALMGYEY